VRRVNQVAIISSLPALLAASWFLYPGVFGGPTICVLKLAAGMPCFGCGLTRAFVCMAHGEFGRMGLYHPIAPVLLVWFTCAWALEIRDMVQRRQNPMPAWFKRFNNVLVFLFLSLWFTRMTVFFAQPEGLKSVITKNLFVRIATWDWSNTHEVFVDTACPPR